MSQTVDIRELNERIESKSSFVEHDLRWVWTKRRRTKAFG